MEERNNNTGLVVLVTVLVMLVLVLAGFIVYDKVINKTNEPNTEENNKENNDSNDNITYTDYDLDDAKKLVDKYYYNWGDFGSTTFEKMDDNDKMYLAYVQLNKNEFTFANCKNLYGNNSNATRTDYGEYNIFILNNEHVCNDESKFISYEKINNVYKTLFGSSNNMPRKAFGLGFDAIDYVDNGFVILDFYGGGDWPTPYIMYDVLSAKLSSENKLTINVGYVKFNIDTEKSKPYSPSFDSTITYKDIENIESSFIKDYSDKVTKLEFVFEKENANFVLKSFDKK